MTRFSVFLPVRNGWPYVQECVESILGQSWPEFELHVLDNQSSDRTLEYLRSLDDPRLRIQTSDRSLSITESWARILAGPRRQHRLSNARQQEEALVAREQAGVAQGLDHPHHRLHVDVAVAALRRRPGRDCRRPSGVSLRQPFSV